MLSKGIVDTVMLMNISDDLLQHHHYLRLLHDFSATPRTWRKSPNIVLATSSRTQVSLVALSIPMGQEEEEYARICMVLAGMAEARKAGH